MVDYKSNSHLHKDPQGAPRPEIQKVIKGEVIYKKKSTWSQFKETFVVSDIKGVGTSVFVTVFVPALKNMLFDVGRETLGRSLFGNNMPGRPPMQNQSGSRVTYNMMPVQRDRPYHPGMTQQSMFANPPRQSKGDIIISSREEAELVLSQMYEILSGYGQVTVAEFNELLGLAATPADVTWGWVKLAGSQVRQIREGYLIDLPQATPLPS